MSWSHKLVALFRKSRLEREMDEELRFHLERQIEDNIKGGMTREEARYAALRAFGGVEQIKEVCRDVRGARFIEELGQDLRYAFRMLHKSRGFTAVAVLALSLATGVNTAIFSLIDVVVLRPLPFLESDRLVMVWEDARAQGWPHNNPAVANFLDWRAENRVFEDMAAFMWWTYSLTGQGEPEKIEGQRATAGLFEILGVKPSLGRVFSRAEDKRGALPVVVISYGFWQRRFGGDPLVIGKSLTLDGESATVIGVMPASFRFPARDVEVWTPMAFHPEMTRNRVAHFLRVVARLRPGVSLKQAKAEMDTIAKRLETEYPRYNANVGITLVPLGEQFTTDARPRLLVLMVGVALVLLIACVNVANLLLARSAVRRQEMAVRAALGAPRLRLLRQLLTESALLSVLGSVCGVLVALWCSGLLGIFIPSELAHINSLRLDARALAFTLALCVFTTLGFGLLPALHSSRLDLNAALKQAAWTSIRGRSRTQGLLVVFQLAFAVALLIGAGLLTRSFVALLHVFPGFRSDHLLTMRIVPPASRYSALPVRAAFYRKVLERVRSLPGVRAAGMISFLPLSLQGGTEGIAIEGRPVPVASEQILDASYRVVTPDYFRAMGIPTLRGRALEESDNETAPLVVVINETMARRFWPSTDAIEKRFRINDPRQGTPWMTIVGIVGDVRQWALDQDSRPEMYVPYAQRREYGYRPLDLVIRSSSDPRQLVSAVKKEIWAVDKDQPVANVSTMEELLREELAPRRVQMILLVCFAAGALALGVVGVYGVMSFAVAQRAREIAIRIAVGASKAEVLQLVLAQGTRLTACGIAAGTAVSIPLWSVLDNALYGVGRLDPLSFLGVPLLLAVLALLASYLPARRAANVDPMTVLRQE